MLSEAGADRDRGVLMSKKGAMEAAARVRVTLPACPVLTAIERLCPITTPEPISRLKDQAESLVPKPRFLNLLYIFGYLNYGISSKMDSKTVRAS